MKIVCISDTHVSHEIMSEPIPEGDVIVHAGDFTNTGKISEIQYFSQWFNKLDFKYKVCIAGNHDLLFQRNPNLAQQILRDSCPSIIYLEDSGVNIEGVNFWGSPWQPRFGNWAFNAGKEIKNKWDKIPEDTDILITHGPAYDVLDRNLENKNCGCPHLLNKIEELSIKYHICGHIHEGHGEKQNKKTFHLNASICDRFYNPSQKPLEFVF